MNDYTPKSCFLPKQCFTEIYEPASDRRLNLVDMLHIKMLLFCFLFVDILVLIVICVETTVNRFRKKTGKK